MDTREPPAKPLRILFVCLANLCRSPMAKALIKAALGNGVETESAGIAPSPARVPAEAVEIVRRRTGADISAHRPRHVLDFRLEEFDFIIGMDSSVFLRLTELPGVPKARLYGWDISDPCGFGPDEYEKTARQIEQQFDQFLVNREMEKRPLKKRS